VAEDFVWDPRPMRLFDQAMLTAAAILTAGWIGVLGYFVALLADWLWE
jgi:hypothetical protein